MSWRPHPVRTATGKTATAKSRSSRGSSNIKDGIEPQECGSPHVLSSCIAIHAASLAIAIEPVGMPEQG